MQCAVSGHRRGVFSLALSLSLSLSLQLPVQSVSSEMCRVAL